MNAKLKYNLINYNYNEKAINTICHCVDNGSIIVQ